MNHEVQPGERTVEASSPGQIFLFGEHAVVYGNPALVAAIGIRAEAGAEPLSGDKIVISSEGVGKLEGKVERADGAWSIRESSGDLEELRFVTKVTELTFNYLDRGEGLELHIDSELPLGAGLGSSSAVTAASAAAVSSVLGESLNRDEISQLAFDAEVGIQGRASRAGVNVASYGGFLRVEGDEIESLDNLPKLNILIGCTGEYGDTGELVEKVRRLKESRPDITEPIIETIGRVTETGIRALEVEDLKKVGVLMDVNQNLLGGLGVSSPELEELVKAARGSGAMGAKLTGAGGGGCMIALCPNNLDKIARAIKSGGGEPIRAKLGVEGLRY